MNLFDKPYSTTKIYSFTALLITICFVFTLILRIILAKSHHSDLGGVEQNVIYSIQRLLFDGKIYTDPGYIPFTITQYTPMYHYICGLVAWICGLDPETDIYQLYRIGRGANVIINLLLAFIVFRISFRKLNLSIPLSIALGLGCFVCVFRQGFTVRPDSLMDFMIILSVYFFLGYLKDRASGRVNLILASVVAATVIFVKQSGVQIPVILLSFLVFVGDWKGLKISLLSFILSFALCAGILFLLYKQVFFLNVIGGVANGIDTSWFIFYVFGNGFKIKILIPAFFVLLITFYRWNIFKADIITRFLCFCACAMLAFAGITVLKSGSNVAYFAPFFTVSLLLFAWQLKALQSQSPTSYYPSIAFTLYFSGICVLNVVHQYKEVKKLEFDNNNQTLTREQLAASVAEYVRTNLKPGEYVFANLNDESIIEESYGRRGINNILFKYCLIPELDIFKSSNVKSGVLGYANFRNAILSKTTKYIIESTTPFHFKIIPDLDKIKNSQYRLAKEIGAYKIYEHTVFEPIR
ncbi:ArnT family glycosyltransferase [Dyadobacter arcticus]|uniref:Glycosyltransferase RgtA/B/C/D-like domain-containing protein n=1 Tax=Dyadobacter arcticus TaxID=1078754 RepID=A0ABX0UL93_9BACT|nr:hypothetical protein [Dyadobacter arcticus]NIJ53647.1 hypothetical protein [Dyadobacter arcticus]